MVSFHQASTPTPSMHLSSSIRATCPAYLILRWNARIILGDQYRSESSSLCSLLHFPVTSSLLGPKIFLSILFWKTLSLCSSLDVRDQASRPYKTTGKITVLYIVIFIFFDSKLEDKKFCTKRYQAFPDFNIPLISSLMEFGFVTFVLNRDTVVGTQTRCGLDGPAIESR